MIKQIEIKEQKYKRVKNGFSKRKIWEASDGKKFDFKRDAEAHEALLERTAFDEKVKKLKRLDVWYETFNYIPDIWYYAGTEEELEIIKRHLGINSSYVRWDNDIEFKVGDWYGYDVDYGGDCYPDTRIITSLTIIKKRMNDFLKNFYNT